MKEVKLIEKLAKMFKEDLYKEYREEIRDPDYRKHESYSSNYNRVSDAIDTATLRLKNVAALAVAKHREAKHGDDNIVEQESLIAVMSEDEIELASASSAWRA